MLHHKSLETIKVTKVKGNADEAMVRMVGFVISIVLETVLLMMRRILVVVGFLLLLLMLAAILLGLWQVVSRSSDFTSVFYCYLWGCS